MKKIIKSLALICVLGIMGVTSVFAATGSGTKNIGFRGNGESTIGEWIGGIKDTTWTTTAKCTITIDPTTSQKPVTTYLTFRKKGTFVNSVLDTTYFYKGVNYGNTSSTTEKKYSKTIVYNTKIPSNTSYDYKAFTSGVSNAYYTAYTINYSYK